MDMEDKNVIVDLLDRLQGGAIDVASFCSTFERLYNFEINRNSLTSRERAALQELFDKVVWYSPIAEERAVIPGYLGEEEIMVAAQIASRRIALHPVTFADPGLES